MALVRDRLWLFACPAGSDAEWLERAGITTPSRMTPVEGCYYLGVPNLILVKDHGQPKPPYDTWGEAMRPLRRVLWSIIGSGGHHEGDELAPVLDLAAKHSNVAGAFMDDFLTGPEGTGQLSPDELRSVRERLRGGPRPLELWVVIYTYQLDLPIAPYLELCDAVTLWTWSSDDLDALPENLARCQERFPGPRKVLGMYLWDYPNNRPVPLERMQEQCARGLTWLREGRISDLVLLGNTVLDLGLEVVEWTRDWVARVGDQVL